MELRQTNAYIIQFFPCFFFADDNIQSISNSDNIGYGKGFFILLGLALQIMSDVRIPAGWIRHGIKKNKNASLILLGFALQITSCVRIPARWIRHRIRKNKNAV